jgi:hypothetical protein
MKVYEKKQKDLEEKIRKLGQDAEKMTQEEGLKLQKELEERISARVCTASPNNPAHSFLPIIYYAYTRVTEEMPGHLSSRYSSPTRGMMATLPLLSLFLYLTSAVFWASVSLWRRSSNS